VRKAGVGTLEVNQTYETQCNRSILLCFLLGDIRISQIRQPLLVNHFTPLSRSEHLKGCMGYITQKDSEEGAFRTVAECDGLDVKPKDSLESSSARHV